MVSYRVQNFVPLLDDPVLLLTAQPPFHRNRKPKDLNYRLQRFPDRSQRPVQIFHLRIETINGLTKAISRLNRFAGR